MGKNSNMYKTETEKLLDETRYALTEMMGLVRALDGDYTKHYEYLQANKMDERIASYYRNKRA